jgi:hypothetical protein
MGMNHLLTPTNHSFPTNGAQLPASSPAQPASQSGATHQNASSSIHNVLSGQNMRQVSTASSEMSVSPENVHVKREPTAAQPSSHESSSSQQNRPLKRSATDANHASQPPIKRERRHKWTERPVWANLASENPRYGQPGVVVNGPEPVKQKPTEMIKLQNGVQPHPGQQQLPPSLPPPPTAAAAGTPDLPIDETLRRMRRLKGKWERSLTGTTKLSNIVERIADWLVLKLNECADVGMDPREGTVEIEAKVGRLYNNDGQRLSLPVMGMTVLRPDWADNNCRFDSQMVEAEHKAMNEYLNMAVENSHKKPNFEKIVYQHLRETDSFNKLSEAGHRALPQSIQRRPLGREIKLRITTDDKTRKVKARIVKVQIGNLHILNPSDEYDLRITMNVECNLDRDGIDEQALIEQPSANSPPLQPRKKDRLSYKHLDYQVDLTRVDVPGLAPKYELELEVDANALRQQLPALMNRQENAFMGIVEGFWENAQLLMRQRRIPQA